MANPREVSTRRERAFDAAFSAMVELRKLPTTENTASALCWLAIAMVHVAATDDDEKAIAMVLGVLGREGVGNG